VGEDEEATNKQTAIWRQDPKEVSDEQYNDFYKMMTLDWEAPLYRIHMRADVPLQFYALLYIPSNTRENILSPRKEPGLKLYARKVLIQEYSKDLLPEYLQFVQGVVDSEDLPLNISRESMQDSALLAKLNKVITSRFLKFLDEEAGKNPDGYQKFYDVYARFLKEGVITDYTHKEPLGKLLRFASSTLEPGKSTSLSEYVTRMASDQKEIYFVIAPTREAAEASPYYEVLANRKYETLFLHDPWDEFVMDHLSEFEGKKVVSAERAELKIDDPAPREGVTPLTDDESKSISTWFREQLTEQVTEVRPSARLVDSPALVLNADKHTSASMKKMMRAASGERPEAMKYELEINPRHPIIVGLNKTREVRPELARKVAAQIFDNARFAAGLLEDPRSMVQRLNSLLEEFLGDKK